MLDENKTRLLESGTLKGPILSLFDDKDSLLPFVISVLYNITIENGGFSGSTFAIPRLTV